MRSNGKRLERFRARINYAMTDPNEDFDELVVAQDDDEPRSQTRQNSFRMTQGVDGLALDRAADGDVYDLQPQQNDPTAPDAVAPKAPPRQDAARAPKRFAKIKKLFARKTKEKKQVDDDDVSLDSIYNRRRAREEEDYDKVEREALPNRPFRDRILAPFASPAMLARLGVAAGLVFVPIFLATFFFSRSLSHVACEILTKSPNLGAFPAFVAALWNSRATFLLFSVVWPFVCAPHFAQIFVDSASGADSVDEWPETNFVGGLGTFLWIACLVGLAGAPGAMLFGAIKLYPVVGFALAAAALTPVFYLSCMQADALFALVTKEIAISLKRRAKSWGVFMGINFAFFFGALFLNFVALRCATKIAEDATGVAARCAVVATVLALAAALLPAAYYRFLGRLAWIVEDDARKRAEEVERLQEDKSEEEFDQYKNEVKQTRQDL